MDNNNDKKMVVIAHVGTITNGTCEELELIPPATTGHVEDKEGAIVSKMITPLFMVINQGGLGWKSRYAALCGAGHDPNRVIEYYGRQTTAKELIQIANPTLLAAA